LTNKVRKQKQLRRPAFATAGSLEKRGKYCEQGRGGGKSKIDCGALTGQSLNWLKACPAPPAGQNGPLRGAKGEKIRAKNPISEEGTHLHNHSEVVTADNSVNRAPWSTGDGKENDHSGLCLGCGVSLTKQRKIGGGGGGGGKKSSGTAETNITQENTAAVVQKKKRVGTESKVL